jgi:hypothetical protein
MILYDIIFGICIVLLVFGLATFVVLVGVFLTGEYELYRDIKPAKYILIASIIVITICGSTMWHISSNNLLTPPSPQPQQQQTDKIDY